MLSVLPPCNLPYIRLFDEAMGSLPELAEDASLEQGLNQILIGMERFRRFLQRAEHSDHRCHSCSLWVCIIARQHLIASAAKQSPILRIEIASPARARASSLRSSQGHRRTLPT